MPSFHATTTSSNTALAALKQLRRATGQATGRRCCASCDANAAPRAGGLRKEIAALLAKWSGRANAKAGKAMATADLLVAWQPVSTGSTRHICTRDGRRRRRTRRCRQVGGHPRRGGLGNWRLCQGAVLYVNRACQGCPRTRCAWPGVERCAKRFSPEDLFRAILFPNRDISPLYRFNEYRLRNGDVHAGRTAFYAADESYCVPERGSCDWIRRKSFHNRQVNARSCRGPA